MIRVVQHLGLLLLQSWPVFYSRRVANILVNATVTPRHEEISQQVVAFNEATKHERGRRKEGEMARELSK